MLPFGWGGEGGGGLCFEMIVRNYRGFKISKKRSGLHTVSVSNELGVVGWVRILLFGFGT